MDSVLLVLRISIMVHSRNLIKIHLYITLLIKNGKNLDKKCGVGVVLVNRFRINEWNITSS